MDEVKTNDEFEPADVICQNCTGQQQQFQIPSVADPNKLLFKKKYYFRWIFQCTQCGKRSKEYTSKISQQVR
jgi:hypothetical protein